MVIAKPVHRALPYVLLAAFSIISISVRPLLPVDETRYLSVAWEMFLRQNFLVPTLNFAPYFQKPPLLFWIIDVAWGVFGVSRIAAAGVIFGISSLVIYLTQRLAKALFPGAGGVAERVPWLMLGSAVFIIYCTLIMFDLLLTVCVLLFTLALVNFANGHGRRYVALAGLFVGLGVLSKGPVMLIHIACPVLLYPLWRNPVSSLGSRQFYAGMRLLAASALVPIVLWLGPALYQAGYDFAYNLVWRQAAGRVTGAVEGAHLRPFYFYLPLFPIALLPWALSFELWRGKPWTRLFGGVGIPAQDLRVVRFLAVWCLAMLIVFSLISGKQPHYLVPMLPPLILLFGYFMATVRLHVFRNSAVIMLVLFGLGQVIASAIVFHRYDLTSLAAFVAQNRGADWAFAGRYQGELTFLARLEKPFTIVREDNMDEWLRTHPNSYLLTKASRYPDVTRQVAFSQLVERGYLVILRDVSATSK